MESFFSPKKVWPDGPYLHFLITLDDPGYLAFAEAHHELFAKPKYRARLGVVPNQWQHSTVQGVHHRLTRDQVERAVEAVRKELAWNAWQPTVQMGPVWPGPSAVTVAMYPEDGLANLNALVRKALSTVEGLQMRPAGDRMWPHTTAAYYRSDDVHDASFNRALRAVRPDRVEITLTHIDAVYMRQDIERGYYTWDHLAALPFCATPKLTVAERLDELSGRAAREGSKLWSEVWERARAVVTPALGHEEISTTGTASGEEHIDGAGALAIALYVLARENGGSPETVTRHDVEEFLGPWEHDERAQAGLPRMEKAWTGRLESLGHRMDDPDDPVMVRWRALCYDHPEPDHDIDGSLYRVGHAGETGLRPLLGSLYRERIRF